MYYVYTLLWHKFVFQIYDDLYLYSDTWQDLQ